MQKQFEKTLPYFIQNLAFDSWDNQNLENSFVEAGFDKNTLEIFFPNRISDFTAEFIALCVQETSKNTEKELKKELSIGERVAVSMHIKISTYHKNLGSIEKVKKFAAFCSLPSNSLMSLKNIFSFSDEIWRKLGDKSTDFSFYTKRLSFSAIYTKSFIYSLSDKSENLTETRKFIDRSIDGLLKVHKYKMYLKDKVKLEEIYKNIKKTLNKG